MSAVSFPIITDGLNDTCQKAEGRNLATVMLHVYRAIPEEMTELREKFRQKIGYWLENTVAYTAPEIFPSDLIWGYAGVLVKQMVSPYEDECWAQRCRDIFIDKIKIDQLCN